MQGSLPRDRVRGSPGAGLVVPVFAQLRVRGQLAVRRGTTALRPGRGNHFLIVVSFRRKSNVFLSFPHFPPPISPPLRRILCNRCNRENRPPFPFSLHRTFVRSGP